MPVQRSFLPDDLVKEFIKQPEVMAKAAAQPCNDFDANAALGRARSSAFDITGVGAAVCRHGFVLLLLNVFGGERWAYSDLALTWIICTLLMHVGVWWYDINCQYHKHAIRCLQQLAERGSMQPLMDTACLSSAIRKVKFPLPAYHESMHVPSCRLSNSYLTMPGVGRGGRPLLPGYSSSSALICSRCLDHWLLATQVADGAGLSPSSPSRRFLCMQSLSEC